MVLKNGIEVKLQRNVLSVLESPTGDEVDDEFDLSSASCDLRVKDHDLGKQQAYRKLLDPSGRANTNNGNCFKEFPTKIHLPPSQFTISRWPNKTESRIVLARMYDGSMVAFFGLWFRTLTPHLLKFPGDIANTKRQKLDHGYLCKVAHLKHQTSFSHKLPKKAGSSNVNDNARLKVTVPKEPSLETANRAQRYRSKNVTELNQDSQSVRLRPSNTKLEPKLKRTQSLAPNSQGGKSVIPRVSLKMKDCWKQKGRNPLMLQCERGVIRNSY